jgi:signal recognition particle subunit SRP54
MFDNLTDRLSRTLRNISGRGRLTEDNIKETLREVRMALLEADVALPVVREFINRVKEKAVGHEVNKSLTPGQEFVKIVRNELVAAMGEENQTLNLAAQPPAVVLMAGLQGAGKTTSVGKLGKFLRESTRKSAGCFCRRVSPGGDQTAGNAGRAGWRGFLPVGRCPEACRHR